MMKIHVTENTMKFNKGVGKMSRILATVSAVVVMATPTSSHATSVRSLQQQDAAPHIERIEIENLYKNKFSKKSRVRIDANTRPEFTLFRLENPLRIVLDIPGLAVADDVLPSSFDEEGIIQRMTSTNFQGQDGPVSRLVVVLREDTQFDAKVEASSILIDLDYNSLANTRGSSSKSDKAMRVTRGAEPGVTPVVSLSNQDEETSSATRLLGVKAKSNAQGAIVTLATNGELKKYEIEEVDNPPRLVIDLHGVKAGKGMDKDWSFDTLKRARVGIHHTKTRVVIDGRLEQLPAYDVASTSEGLMIVFDNKVTNKQSAVTKVERFKHESKKGFERLHATISGPVTVRTVANGPRKKTIALDGVTMEAAQLGFQSIKNSQLIEGLELTEGARKSTTHVTMVVASDVEHSVWQKQGKLFWDVRGKNQKAEPVAQTSRPQPRAAGYSTELALTAHEGMAAKRYRGKKITIDLQEADIVNVIRLLGDVSGMNVVIDEDVTGNVTIKLKNVPWDQALDVILRTKSLGKEVKGGIIRIALQSKLNAERQARLDLLQESRDKQPTAVRLIPVNFAVASELAAQVKEVLSERGKVTTDERTNVIVVEDIRVNLDQAEQLVKTLDTETPLVLIEARMVEASTSFSRSLGIQWGGGLLSLQSRGNPTGLIFPNNLAVSGSEAQMLQLAPQESLASQGSPTAYAVNLPASEQTAGVGLHMGSVGNSQFLHARISAAETNGEAKLVSAPKVTTLNNEEAVISQGTDRPVVITTQNQMQTQIVQARLALTVTPHVTADGSILLDVSITNDELKGARGIPEISRKTADTQMLIKNGDTAVIGGIYTRQYFRDDSLTPFLGSIPVIGWLFKSSTTQDNRSEMLVFLSPRIVNRAVSN